METNDTYFTFYRESKCEDKIATDIVKDTNYCLHRFGQFLLSFGILVKSRTLVYVFAIVALGTFLISTGSNIPNILVATKLICAVYFLALATYLYNDLTDYNVDRINKRKTVFSSEPSKYHATLYSTILFFLISISLAFSINFQTGATSLVFLVLAITYSHPKTHFKDKFVLKTLVTAAGGSIASLMGYFASGSFSYLGIISSFIAFMFWFTLGPLGDVNDIRGDKQNGRRTFPIVIGMRNTFLLMHLVITAIASLIFLLYYLDEITIVGLILSASVCFFTYFMIRRVSKHYEDKKIIKQTRTTLRYSLFAIQLMIFLGLITGHVIL